MDSARFDGLARRFGQSVSRRQSLRGLAGVVAGASALGLSLRARARGIETPVLRIAVCHLQVHERRLGVRQ